MEGLISVHLMVLSSCRHVMQDRGRLLRRCRLLLLDKLLLLLLLLEL
jgi:hypothetical protein